MADLPDIDTSSVSYIAYFNAVTQGGASSISPSDVLSSGSITSSTTYDNGIEGELSPQTSAFRSTIQFRVKSDGWIVAYIDRRLNLDQVTGTQANVIGPWDVLGEGADTSDSPNVYNANNTELAYVIEHLISQLSNSGSVTYTRGDEALFNYEYASADVTRVLRIQGRYSRNPVDVDYTFTKTTGTTLAAMWVGSNIGDPLGTSTNHQSYYEGTQLSSDENGRYGVVDAISAGTAPGAGETVALNYQSGDNGNLAGWVLTLYS